MIKFLIDATVEDLLHPRLSTYLVDATIPEFFRVEAEAAWNEIV